MLYDMVFQKLNSGFTVFFQMAFSEVVYFVYDISTSK